MIDTGGLTAERCVELLDGREVSCRELASAYLDKIDRDDGRFHAFLRTRREAALAEADAFDRDGRTGLQGVPIALKDILCTKDEETTAGSRILEGFRPMYDGGCVSRVKGAGLVSLGKTNLRRRARRARHPPRDPGGPGGRLRGPLRRAGEPRERPRGCREPRDRRRRGAHPHPG